jgi:amino acid transporter
MFWVISAASISGYVILALFVLAALARLAKHGCLALAEKLPRRSRAKHYLVTWVSAAFFSLLTVRACYIAAVIVDTQFRSDTSEVYSARK